MRKQKVVSSVQTDLKEELEILRDLGVTASEMEFLIREKQQQDYRSKF